VSGSSWYGGNTFALTVASVACLACVALACTAPLILAAAGARGASVAGLEVIPLCAWARNGRAGLWWNSAVSPIASVSLSNRYSAVCVAAPWAPLLPDRGGPSIDYTP
jgi:hypothetical protein